MGSTTFLVEPKKERLQPSQISVNLDDPGSTFLSRNIHAERDYDSVEDAFPNQLLINNQGRGVRGHAIATPLLGFLPLTLSGVSLSLSGGTETPGAPFIDALRFSTVPVLNTLFDLQIGGGVDARGTFGIGGGSVWAGNGSDYAQVLPDRPQFLTYWSERLTTDTTSTNAQAARENKVRIRSLLPDVELVDITYDNAHTTVNQLLLVPQQDTSFARDISFCGEENTKDITGDAFEGRVRNELAHRENISRFHVEQVLLMAATKEQSGSWRTERLTPHIQAVIKLVETLTSATVRITDRSKYAMIEVF